MPQDPFAAYAVQEDPFAAYLAQPQATPPPAAATAGMPAPSLTTDRPIDELLRGVEVMGGPIMPPIGQIPGILSTGGGLIQKGLSALTRAAGTKTGGAALGAAEEGLRTRGDLRSMAQGAVGGALGSSGFSWLKKLRGIKADDAAEAAARSGIAKGMGRAGADSDALRRSQSLLDTLTSGSTDDVLALGKGVRPTVTPAVPRDALADEILAREIDWRITDAVPIDAMKRAQGMGGSIIEAGESLPGLGERLAKAIKIRDAKDADRLARAIRQRGHITEKRR